jgi:hypothetical protein
LQRNSRCNCQQASWCWPSSGILKGLFLRLNLERGTTVTIDMLQRGLKPAICSKRRGSLSEGVLLLHGNTRPHTVAHTLETLQDIGVGSHWTSSSQSKFGAIWFSPFWTT